MHTHTHRCRVSVRGQPRYVHPLLVTGLKAWHLRQGHAFLTVSNTEECMKALPGDAREIVFVCGEIDCREGLPGAVEKKKYPTMAAAVDATVQAYVKAIDALAATYKVDIKVLTVMPPCNPKVARRVCVCVCVLARARARFHVCVCWHVPSYTTHTHTHTHTHEDTHQYTDRIDATRRFNAKLREIFAPQGRLLDIFDEVVGAEGVAKAEFNCDGTHMNRGIVPLLQRELDAVFR